jgi:hypothetical protein
VNPVDISLYVSERLWELAKDFGPHKECENDFRGRAEELMFLYSKLHENKKSECEMAAAAKSSSV